MSNFMIRKQAMVIALLFLVFPLVKAQAQDNAQVKPPQIVRKSTGIFQTGAIRRVLPAYPQEARAEGLTGEVIIEVLVDTNGTVISTKPVSGHQYLVAAAMRALKEWKFPPTQLSGMPVQIIGNAVFTFAKNGTVTEGSQNNPVNQETPAQTIQSASGESLPPHISDRERRELLQKFPNTYDIPLRVNNPENVVLEITKATVKAISRETNDTSTSSYVADYALQMMIELLNKTDKRITGLGLKFINIESRQVFFSYPHINGIEPQGSYQVQFGLMTISGNPTNLLVELVGVRFDGGKTGGAFPAHPPLPFASTVPVNPQVDSKPRPLNRLRPTYTDEARKNKITGAVRLRLEVGADGSVKNVYVLNALPDGLTEEAIRIVKVLQFQPAMRNGSPVEYAIVMEIEFDLL